jgi:filamentous hemagglutinin family protein
MARAKSRVFGLKRLKISDLCMTLRTIKTYGQAREVTALTGVSLLVTAALALFPGWTGAQVPVNQLPSGARVVGGAATVSAGEASLTINQTSARAAIDWQSFNVGRGATVNFVQPDARSVVLNKVLGGTPSSIYGNIRANGSVYLVNPQGVYFSPTSSVDVGSLVASTLGISSASFMGGYSLFSRDSVTAGVQNDGRIQVGQGGYAALLGPQVTNNGVIAARSGTVALASGDVVALNFDRQGGLLGLAVTPASVQSLVQNNHLIQASDGTVLMTAKAASQLLGSVVNTGVVSANQLSTDVAGRIVLGASGQIDNSGTLEASAARGHGGEVSLTAPSINVSGVVDVSGQLSGGQLSMQQPAELQGAGAQTRIELRDARLSATSSAGKGGGIAVAADHIQIHGGSVDASGALGGGQIAIGGSALGLAELYGASDLTIGQDVQIRANALLRGDGGTVVLRTNPSLEGSTARIGADIQSLGADGGRGGQVDTSGNIVHLDGIRVAAGYWIIDPQDLTINSSLASSIMNALATSDVTVATGSSSNDYYTGTNIQAYSSPGCTGVSCTGATGTNTGKITVSSPINWSSNNALKIIAYGDVVVNYSIQNSAAGNVTLSSLTGDVAIKPLLTANASQRYDTTTVYVGSRNGVTNVYAARDVKLTTAETSAGCGTCGNPGRDGVIIGAKLGDYSINNSINVNAGRDINMMLDAYSYSTPLQIGNGNDISLYGVTPSLPIGNVVGAINVTAGRDLNMRSGTWDSQVKIGNGMNASGYTLGSVGGDININIARYLTMRNNTFGILRQSVQIGNGHDLVIYASQSGSNSGNITINVTGSHSFGTSAGAVYGTGISELDSLPSGSLYMAASSNDGGQTYNKIGNGGKVMGYVGGTPSAGPISGDLSINVSKTVKLVGSCTSLPCGSASKQTLVIGNGYIHPAWSGQSGTGNSTSNTGALTLTADKIQTAGNFYSPPIGSQDTFEPSGLVGDLVNATGFTTYTISLANPDPSTSSNFNYTLPSLTGTIVNSKTSYNTSLILPVLTWDIQSPASFTYGDYSTFTNSASSDSSGAVTYSSGNASILNFLNSASATANVTGAGTVTVTATVAASGNYNSVTATYSLTINKKTITLSASKAYDGNATFAASAFTAGGLVGSDAQPTLGGAVAGTGVLNVSDSGGSAPITGLTINSNNYQLPASATFSVTPAAPNLTFANASPSATYGDGTFTQTATSLSGGAITYSSGNTGVLQFGSASSSTGDVLSAGAATVTANIAAAGNFAAGTATYSLTVNKKTLTLTASKPYDGNGTFALNTFTVGGLVGSDAAPALSGASQNTAVVNVADSGSHPVSGISMVSANYQLPATATFTVLGVAPNLSFATANPSSITYGDGTFTNVATSSNSSGAITYSSSNSGVLSFASAASAAGTVSGAGASTVTAHIAADGNYISTTATYNLTVDKKTLTLTASKPYDGNDGFAAGRFTIGGLVGQDAAPVLAGSATGTHVSNVAQSGTSAGVTGLTLSSSNYMLPVSAVYSVTPAPLALALTGTANKIYDGALGLSSLTPGNYVFTGFAPGEGAAVSKSAGVLSSKDVGTGIMVSVGLSAPDITANNNTQVGNYVWPVSASGNIGTITRLPSVTWTGGSSGLWSDPSNWTATINGQSVVGAIPDKANVANVYIPNGSTVTFDAAVPTLGGQVQVDQILGGSGSTSSVGSLTLTGGRLFAAGNVVVRDLVQMAGELVTGSNLTVQQTLNASGGVLSSAGNLTAADFTMSGAGTRVNVGGDFTTTRSLTVTDGLLSVAGRSDITATGQDLNFSDSHFSFGGPVSVSAASLSNSLSQITLERVQLSQTDMNLSQAPVLPVTPSTSFDTIQVIKNMVEVVNRAETAFSVSLTQNDSSPDAESRKTIDSQHNSAPVIQLDCIGDSNCKK